MTSVYNSTTHSTEIYHTYTNGKNGSLVKPDPTYYEGLFINVKYHQMFGVTLLRA